MRAAMALARLAARWRPLSAVPWTPWANARGMASAAGDKAVLPRDGNQARGIAEYAIGFLGGEGKPAGDVMKHTKAFYVDASLCGVSAIALQTNAPAVLRREAARYPAPDAARGATVLGSSDLVMPEKAALANGAAVREWDSNGTNFGYNPALGHTAGEFGHNDFYGVAVAACQMTGRNGADALLAMACLDEIRGRLAEVFSLKSYKVDHVVHGAIASAAVYGALLGATAEQIEMAIGMVVAHHIPFRAIRAGKQLSDSKGSSAGISTEAAMQCVHRTMDGFLGPRDVFRNPEAIFRLFEGPGQMLQKVNGPVNLAVADASPFDLHLSNTGSDFSVMGMHFKLGLYEHQSAGAIQGILNLVTENPSLRGYGEDRARFGVDKIAKIRITAYEPAFGIIGNPEKRDPTTRQSADHSMCYIVSRVLAKAFRLPEDVSFDKPEDPWKKLMLLPYDYSKDAIYDPLTRAIMERVVFEHGGEEYDKNYPDGIPTSLTIEARDTGSSMGSLGSPRKELESGFIMYPGGHARNTSVSLDDVLAHKFKELAALCVAEGDASAAQTLVDRFSSIDSLDADGLRKLHNFDIVARPFTDN